MLARRTPLARWDLPGRNGAMHHPRALFVLVDMEAERVAAGLFDLARKSHHQIHWSASARNLETARQRPYDRLAIRVGEQQAEFVFARIGQIGN